MEIQFPHINRKLTATVLFVLFLLVNFLNLWHNHLFKIDEEKKLRLLLLQNPASSGLHEQLGLYYVRTNEQAAQREYKLAQEYSNVLGTGSPWQTWQNLLSRKNNAEQELKYWKTVTEIYPDYLYAYLKLAEINWQKGSKEEAKNYLKIVRQKDPTNKTALEIKQGIE